MDDVMVGKVTISVSLKKIQFPKISEQAPLRSEHIIPGLKEELCMSTRFSSRIELNKPGGNHGLDTLPRFRSMILGFRPDMLTRFKSGMYQ